jgi:hypothetical protein
MSIPPNISVDHRTTQSQENQFLLPFPCRLSLNQAVIILSFTKKAIISAHLLKTTFSRQISGHFNFSIIGKIS